MPGLSLAELVMKVMQMYNPRALSVNFSSAFYRKLSYDRIKMIGSVEPCPITSTMQTTQEKEAEEPPVLMSP